MYRKFKLNKDLYKSLSLNELKILQILEKVVIGAGEIYDLQLKEGFYPKKVLKKRIEEAEKKHPAILSPFTYISEEGEHLFAQPYHQRYHKQLEPLAKELEKAAEICENKSFKVYLRLRAKSLLDGSYKQADIAWLKVKNSKLDFSIGPFERYMDSLFFIKRIFQAHVAVISQEETKLAKKFEKVLYSSATINYSAHHSTRIAKKGVEVLVEDTPVTSGYASDTLFTGEHFPGDLDIMEQYGSKILIYKSHIKLRFDSLRYMVFKSLFEGRFAKKYSKDLLYKTTLYSAVIYELGRQLHKFPDARRRLKELYGIIDKANSYASGIQHCKYLFAKGMLSQDEFEAMIIDHILWMFCDWLFYQKNPRLEMLVKAKAIGLNYYLSSGALRESNGIYWPNFSKIFFEIESLAVKLVYLLERGTYEEAKKFVEENANLDNFKRLSKNLKNLPVKF